MSISMLNYLVFLLIWRFLPSALKNRHSQKLTLTLFISVIIWIAGAGGTYFAVYAAKEFNENPKLHWVGLVCVLLYLIIAILVVFLPKLPVARRGDRRVSWGNYLLRFISGMLLTSLAVGISIFDDLLSGICLAFPTIPLIAMVTLWYSQGETVATASTAPMIIGSVSNGFFGILVALLSGFLSEHMGDVLGLITVICGAWVLSVSGISVFFLWFLKRKENRYRGKVTRIII
eukprot:TRINITY_DN4777_c0_g1_i2.p1 TRINITY_DN4777_c0_g1~~TRINITY_DN4777_c0_g1_i2.p1  ORF type:complete len:232 (+),score=20.31 TRINITY_DN4777_c0_g1_i2:240-935(+)